MQLEKKYWKKSIPGGAMFEGQFYKFDTRSIDYLKKQQKLKELYKKKGLTWKDIERRIKKSAIGDRKDFIKEQRRYMAEAYGKALNEFRAEYNPVLRDISAQEAEVSLQLKPTVSRGMISRGRRKEFIPYRQRIKYLAQQRKYQKQAIEPFRQARSQIKSAETELVKQKQRWDTLAAKG